MMKKSILYILIPFIGTIFILNCECASIKDFEINQDKAVIKLQQMLEDHAHEEALGAYPHERVTYVTVVDRTVLGESYIFNMIVHMTGKITIDLEISGSVIYDEDKNGYWIKYTGVRSIEYRKNGYLDKPAGVWEFGRN